MGHKVLAVDDSKTMRDMMTFTLKGAGHDVIEAEDGAAALEALGSASVDLVITDVNMPRMDGLTLVEKLRGLTHMKSVPILILTTESDEDLRARGRAAGATGWIVKPFNPSKLLSIVDKVCPPSN